MSWRTVKPFFSDKESNNSNYITLTEKKIITSDREISNNE